MAEALVVPAAAAARAAGRQATPNWPRNPIDHFVLARLEREGLKPSPEADRATLIRRVTLDLTGLPPTPAEVDAFLHDPSPNAYEKVVDRLLASPRYGERMAMRWLDAARYADTNGYQTDGERFMWRWRDWVIDAFNRNMPFDQFTIEQIAGDLLPRRHARPEHRHRLQPQSPRQRRRRHHPRRVRGRVRRRSRRDHGDGLAGPDARLRALPRPQVRSVHAEGVLPALRLLQQRAGARQGDQVRQFAAGHSGADAGAGERNSRILKTELAAAEARLARLEPEVAKAQRAWEDIARAHGRPRLGAVARREQSIIPLDGNLHGDITARSAALGEILLPDGQRAPVAEPPASVATEPVWREGEGALCSRPDRAGRGFRRQALRRGGQHRQLRLLRFASRCRPGSIRPRLRVRFVSRAQDEAEGQGWRSDLKDGHLQASLVLRWLDDGARVESEASVPLNRWSHVALTYDGSRMASGVRLYLNGEPLKLKVPAR